MNKKIKIAGMVLAASAATVFAIAPAAASTHSSKSVHCMGVNTCKGHGSCKSASNSCKGQNTCKGQGVVEMSKTACDQVGGTVGDGKGKS